MKAVVYYRYGSPDVLALAEVEEPVVGDGQVLVRVRAASVNRHDWHFLTGAPTMVRLMAGLRRPRAHVLGIDASGRVEAVGTGVERFQAGDAVYGASSHGCFAEYVCVPEEELALKPPHVSYEEAAAVPAAARIALQALRDHGRLQPGQRVLINGASGGVGTFAVQIAKALGAEVTGVCSTRNVDVVRAIGADHVVDYTRVDFVHRGQRYDLIFDVVANRSFAACKEALRSRGTYVTTRFSPGLALQAKWVSAVGGQRMVSLLAARKPEDLADVAGLLREGRLRPVIDRCYTLGEVPEALRYVGQGHARGKVAITV
jgi:NADPH:quinone reductase-like Zn-dependent oxidoreductase